MASSSTKEVSYSFLFVLDFSTQQENGDLAFENKPLERNYRQVLTSLGLFSRPQSNVSIFFCATQYTWGNRPRVHVKLRPNSIANHILSYAQECSDCSILSPTARPQQKYKIIGWWIWVWVAVSCWWAKIGLMQCFIEVFASKRMLCIMKKVSDKTWYK